MVEVDVIVFYQKIKIIAIVNEVPMFEDLHQFLKNEKII